MLLASAAPLVPAAASASPLTLEDAIRYAVAHNASVVKQQAVVAQDREAYIKQRGLGLPPVDALVQNQLSKSENYGGTFALIGQQQASVFAQNTEQIGTNYTYYTGGLLQIQTLLAKQQLDQAETELHQTQQQISSQVSDGFFNITLKDETVGLQQSNVTFQTTLVKIAQAKVQAGVSAGVDVLRAQVSQAKSQSAVVSARADAENARESLAQLIGAPLDTQFAVPKRVPQPPPPGQSLDQLVQLAQSHRPEVLAANDAVEIAKTNLRTVNQDLYPSVQLTAAFGNQSSPTNAAQLNSEGVPVPRVNPGFWLLGATSTWQLPLVDYGTRKANRENFNAQISAAQSGLDTTQTQVALDVRTSYRAAQTALAQVSYTTVEVREGTEASRIARLQYQAGIIALTDVLQAQSDSLSAQDDLFNARTAYVQALVKLRLATGLFQGPDAVADLR
jgi:outer membrane protein